MSQNLLETLAAIGKHPEQYLSPDGSRLLLLPYGSRVLGLFAPDSDQNLFWTHPSLSSTSSAASFYHSSSWQNSGGDRTWLAPEVDVCFPNFPDTSFYRVPVELDPGNYRVIRTGQLLRFVGELTVTLSRSYEKLAARITKSWEAAPNPLRRESFWDALEGVKYAGYTQHTSLEVLGWGESDSAQIGLWNLLALPYGGEVLIPTFTKVEPRIYSGPIDPTNLIVTEHLVQFRMQGAGISKIGIRAVASTGRLGYIYPDGNNWAFIVRNFAVNPSGEYIDIPWNQPVPTGDLSCSTQACAVNNELGAFCELEYHAPAIDLGKNQSRSDDTSQVWAFRGPRHGIQEVIRNLLSPDL
jgi:hypothetical protein